MVGGLAWAHGPPSEGVGGGGGRDGSVDYRGLERLGGWGTGKEWDQLAPTPHIPVQLSCKLEHAFLQCSSSVVSWIMHFFAIWFQGAACNFPMFKFGSKLEHLFLRFSTLVLSWSMHFSCGQALFLIFVAKIVCFYNGFQEYIFMRLHFIDFHRFS